MLQRQKVRSRLHESFGAQLTPSQAPDARGASGFGVCPGGFQSCFGLILPCLDLISSFWKLYYVTEYCLVWFCFLNFTGVLVIRLLSLSRQFYF